MSCKCISFIVLKIPEQFVSHLQYPTEKGTNMCDAKPTICTPVVQETMCKYIVYIVTKAILFFWGFVSRFQMGRAKKDVVKLLTSVVKNGKTCNKVNVIIPPAFKN